MAINKNHEFEELGGVKCAIVEKNASKARVAFLKELLEYNGFEVVIVSSPPPKPTPASSPAAPSVSPPATAATPTSEPSPQPLPQSQPEPQPPPPPPPLPETFTVGVTNLAFNPTNAIFGRMLKTKEGHIVTQAYWYQKDNTSRDEIPYYEQKL